MSTDAIPTPPSWAGLLCMGTSREELNRWLEIAAQYNFNHVQAALNWSPLMPADFVFVKQRLDDLKLKCPSCGIYNDLYKWDGPLHHNNTGEDLLAAITHAPLCGWESVVCWSGSAHPGLGHPEPKNRTPEAYEQLCQHAQRLLPALKTAGVKLLLEPWKTHVLGDENIARQFCEREPTAYGMVWDPINYIQLEQWEQRHERIRQVTQTLGDYLGIIHLKDAALNEKKDNIAMPMTGRGTLDLEVYLGAMKPWIGKLPIIAEHVSDPADLPELIQTLNSVEA